jgi:hypothetical protein
MPITSYDEDGIVRTGHLLHGVDDAAHLVVAVRRVLGEHFHHPGINAEIRGPKNN